MSVHNDCALPISSHQPVESRDLLLYYAYVDLRDAQSDVCDWMRSKCEALRLVGRVRVAKDGINATVGGECTAIAEHIAAVRAHQLLGQQHIDFKLAPWPPDCSAAAVAEAGFNALTITACKHVVALGRSSHIHNGPCNKGFVTLPHCQAAVSLLGQPNVKRLCLSSKFCQP
jgi:predicted sulfurtransferase